MKIYCAITLLVVLCVSSPSTAQTRKYSNAFLDIGVGARSLGMAGAQVASVSDVSAGFWNPAGLASLPVDLQLDLMHSEYFAGIANFDYGSIAKPLADPKRYVGFTIIRLGIDDIPNTLNLIAPDGSVIYDNITSFSFASYAFLASYAQQLKVEGLRVGGNFKVVHHNVGTFASSWGFGMDAGMQYDYKDWKFGLLVKDITSTFNAWSFSFTDDEKAVLAATGNTIPESSLEITLPKIILGGAYYKQFMEEKISLLAELDIDITTDGKRNVLISANPLSFDPHLGFEVGYVNTIFIRGGVGNIQRATNDEEVVEDITTFQPNIGLGLKIRNLRIDYALTDVGNQSEAFYSHVFSLMVDINKDN
ncbi:MAG: hypothetical protein IIA45_12390 [Bacteroidetes bacterium]|nr:hypothetical protein [Bacteroidota bacterium]